MAESVADYRRYLDPRTLARISGLDLRARLIVERLMTGMHRSPYQGISVEFSQHRPYVAGDDIRHVDWKVFGRSDKIYLFFFSSRRRHTMSNRDWSSDVCSSDLLTAYALLLTSWRRAGGGRRRGVPGRARR